VACHELDEDALYSILKNSEGSIIRQYCFAFSAFGINASFTDDALKEIATLASKEKTGARALMTILEKILRDFKYELPSTDIIDLEITPEIILNPKKELNRLLKGLGSEEDITELKLIRTFERQFEKRHQMKISFDKNAVKFICDKAKTLKVPADELCATQLQSYEHGLKLIQQNTGQSEFVITEEIVKFPSEALEKMVKESYNKELKGVEEATQE